MLQKVHKQALARILAYKNGITVETISDLFIGRSTAKNFLKWCTNRGLLVLAPDYSFYITEDTEQKIREMLTGQQKLVIT